MASIDLFGEVNLSIERDHNSGTYYLCMERNKQKDLPIPLGKVIEPENTFRRVQVYLADNNISFSASRIRNQVAILLRQLIRESGTEDTKTLDAKLLKWQRKKQM